MKTDLPSLLTASSILLGVLTALYGVFYPDIKSILDIIPKTHTEDNKKEYNRSKDVFNSKYIPLLIGTLVISILFIPELYRQVVNSINVINEYGIKNTTYDTLAASFIAICCFMNFMTYVVIKTGVRLKNKIGRLKK